MKTLSNDDPDTAYNVLAALFLTATTTTAGNEADGAFRALRRKLVGARIDPHTVADRIRGHESYAPRDEAPVFTSMPPSVRRLWLDTITLRLRLSDWERRFVGSIRPMALSSFNRLSAAQMRTLQKLVDRAWAMGVRP